MGIEPMNTGLQPSALTTSPPLRKEATKKVYLNPAKQIKNK